MPPPKQPPRKGYQKSSETYSTSDSIHLGNMCALAAEGNLEAIVRDYLADQSLVIPDKDGNIPLHHAAKFDQRSAARGLIALSMPQQTWMVKNHAGQTPLDLASARIKKDMNLLNLNTLEQDNHHTGVNHRFVTERMANPKPNHKVLVSLDGGGIKAILVAGTILAIERAMGDGENIMSRTHWIGGTSCGGIISLLFGCGYTCDQVRRLFLREKLEVFCGNNGHYLPKHASRGIEKTLRKYLGKHTRLADIQSHKIMVTSAKIRDVPASLVLFRTYAPDIPSKEFEKYGYLDPKEILVWKAARSTSAAPVYFDSFHDHADGAIVCNNPCLNLITDFHRLKKIEEFRKIANHDEIGVILSLGSGHEPTTPLGGIDPIKFKYALGRLWEGGKKLFTLFMNQATSSHAVLDGQAREWAHSLGIPYFRFSPKLTKAIELDNTNMEDIFDFMFENEVYLTTQVKHELEALARLLKTMPRNEKLKQTKDIIR